MMAERPNVFISYSHKDEVWKDRVVAHLRVLEMEGALDVWDDRRIGAGHDWRPEIEQAIERAKIAILIVSKDFLTSKFIREQELTKILAGRTEGRLRVIPLIAEPCAWQAVSVLKGIQARPRDGRALSAGSAYQIDADLTALAVEVVSGLQPGGEGSPSVLESVQPSGVVRSTSVLAWVSGSGLLAGLLTITAAYWPLSTVVSLDIVTERVSFVVRGTPQSLDPAIAFSALTMERCGSVTFEGVDLRSAAGPDRGAAPGPRLTRLTCLDPAAKITLTSADDTRVKLGAIPAIVLDPGTTVGLEITGQTVPVVTIELSGQISPFDVPLERDFDVVANFVDAEPSSAPGAHGLVRYKGTLQEDALRHVAQVEMSDRGAVLVAAVTDEGPRAAFPGGRIPVDAIRVDKETPGGGATTALLDDASLSYRDYPIPALSIPKDEAIVLEQMAEAEIRGLSFELVGPSTGGVSEPAIKLTVVGSLVRGSIGTGDRGVPERPSGGRWSDPRLTAFDVVAQKPSRVAFLAIAWTIGTFCCASAWKKLSRQSR